MNEKNGRTSREPHADGRDGKQRAKAHRPAAAGAKRTAVAALLMLIPFCAFMYLIFGDTDAGEGPGTGGINTTIPDGKVQRIEASRQKAAEKVEAEALAGNKIQSLGEAVSLPEPDSALRITTSLPAGGIDRSQDAHRGDGPADRIVLQRSGSGAAHRRAGAGGSNGCAESWPRKRPPRALPPDPMELVERQYALATKYFETPEKARTEMPAARGDRVPVTKVRRPRVGSYRRWPVLRRIPQPPQRTPRRVIPDSTPR